MGNCAILIMVLMVVSANRAQEKLIKLASIQDTTPTLEPLNAKVFVLYGRDMETAVGPYVTKKEENVQCVVSLVFAVDEGFPQVGMEIVR